MPTMNGLILLEFMNPKFIFGKKDLPENNSLRVKNFIGGLEYCLEKTLPPTKFCIRRRSFPGQTMLSKRVGFVHVANR
jgi:hypothetical protein